MLVRAKGNLAGDVPTLEFRIASHVFKLNGHTFDEPHAVDWQESDLTTQDVLHVPSGGRAGRPRDEGNWRQVESALSDKPLSVRAIATTAGVSKSTVQDILAELAEDGEAVKTSGGWVSGNSRVSNYRTPFPDSKNGSTKQNTVSGNVSRKDGNRTLDEGISGHPPSGNGWQPHTADEEAPDWWPA